MNVFPFEWVSHCITHVGRVREINEDACLDLPEQGLWVVADGMGGHDAGDVASRLVVDSLRDVGGYQRFSEFVDDVEQRLIAVNQSLVEQAQRIDAETTIGSTVVALLAYGRHCVCLWAGDSRLYRYRGGRLVQISRDHSEVEELIRRGVVSRQNAGNHQLANVITRAVGAAPELYLDAELNEIMHGDRFLLCSDGLNKEVSDREIRECMATPNSEKICETLVNLALSRGCRDNITVVAAIAC